MNNVSDSRENAPAVLIVDDNPKNLVALEAVLECLDCRVVRANSGLEAVERTRGQDFAAIVMDVRMPTLDGYAAASFIRQNPRSATTPMLFMTAHDDIEVAKLTRLYGNTGQVDSLQKPFEINVLRSKIRWWLELFSRGQQLQQLELAKDSADEEARTKDEVLSVVAHDLKGPLATLALSASNLRRQTTDGVCDPQLLGSIQRHLDLTDRNIEMMTMIVDDLLESARLESGALQLNLALCRFDAIVSQAIALLEPLADQKGVALGLQGSDGAAECDRNRMLQVLSNLLGNAVKFTPSAGYVQVETTCSEGELVVCVRDTGPGITSDQLPHIFEKYWQGNRHLGRGVGLGLSIAQGIVLAHGGRMWAESQAGEGSRFFFSIPRSAPPRGSVR